MITKNMTHNNKNAAHKVVFYCRKSHDSEDRQVASIPAQIQECHRLAERHGISTQNIVIIEESQTAKKPGRPKFNDMIARINKGEFDTVICWKLDRLARNPIDGPSLIWMLSQKMLKRIITISNTYLPEDNHVMMYLEFGMADQYSKDLSVNIRRGNRAKVESGWWTGPAPLGYLNNPDKRAEEAIIPDPDRFYLVRKMWEMMLSGSYTPPQILDIATDEWALRTPRRGKNGGTRIAKSTIYALFSNPFYYGHIRRGDNEALGKHKQMVTKDEFDKVQILLKRNSSPRPQIKQFGFRGFIKCGECGCSITAEDKKNRFGARYTYYHCTKKRNTTDFKCSQRVIRIEELQNQIREAIESCEITPEFQDWCYEYLKYKHQEESFDRTKVLSTNQKSLKEVVMKLDNLYDMRLNKLISDNEYLEKRNVLASEKLNYETMIQNISIRQDNWLNLGDAILNFASNARKWFNEGTIEQRNQILQTVGSSFVLKEGKVFIEFNEPFQLLHVKGAEMKEFQFKLESGENRFEPYKNSDGIRTNKDRKNLVVSSKKRGFEPANLPIRSGKIWPSFDEKTVWWR